MRRRRRGRPADPNSVIRIKAAIRERDGHRCAKCGMTADEHREQFGKNLDVHRTTPGSEYSVEPGVCVTLCRTCHGPEPRRPRGTYPTGRVNVGLSEAWFAVLDELATIHRRPASWQVLVLVEDEAKRLGIPTPPGPWSCG